MSERPVVRVAAAILIRGDGRVLLAQRLPGTPYPGFWEFPGGKLEPGESAVDALRRELDEELGVAPIRVAPWLTRRYAYSHAYVELAFFRVFDWQGDPHGRDGQPIAWHDPAAIDLAPLLPANAAVLRALALPPVYAITMAEDLGEEEFLDRAGRAMAAGIRLVQVRENSFAPQRLRALAERVLALAAPHGARVLVNGAADTARRLGLAGVHWTAGELLAAKARPADMLCAASTHDATELAQAALLGVDFAVLGPVHATPSHPDARPLGWRRFAELVQGSPLPVYALGGLAHADRDTAIAYGAHGIALRRAAWPA